MTLLDNPNPLKLVVFGANVLGGCNLSVAPSRVQATWAESVRLALAAEAAGLDAMVPISRWVGFGGASRHNDRCFETCTWAAGIAAATQAISVFATVHVQSIHPVRMAKQATTIDHISRGRFGLNVVAGYVRQEIEMFGLDFLPNEDRYSYATEWMEIVRRVWSGETFDYEGRFFRLKGAYGNPGPVQQPFPMVMNAGNSKDGSAFAARFAEMNYINLYDPAAIPGQVADVRRTARELAGKDVLVMAPVGIICRDSKAEVAAYKRWLMEEVGDVEAGRNLANALAANTSSASYAERMLERVVLCMNGWPIIGTPDEVAIQIGELAEAGLDGLALTWPDYDDGVARYHHQLLPRLREAGLRV